MTGSPWQAEEAASLQKQAARWLTELGFPHKAVKVDGWGEGCQWAFEVVAGKLGPTDMRVTVGLLGDRRLLRLVTSPGFDQVTQTQIRGLRPEDRLEMLDRMKILLLQSSVDWQMVGNVPDQLAAVHVIRHMSADALSSQALFKSILRVKDAVFKILVALEMGIQNRSDADRSGPRKIATQLPPTTTMVFPKSDSADIFPHAVFDQDLWDDLEAMRGKDESFKDVVRRLVDERRARGIP